MGEKHNLGAFQVEDGFIKNQAVSTGSVHADALGDGLGINAVTKKVELQDVLPSNLDYKAGRWLHTSLQANDAAAGLVSLQNTTGNTLFILRCIVENSTPSSGACTGDFGVAATAVSSDLLLDGIDLEATPTKGAYDNHRDGDNGANGEVMTKWSDTAFFTGSVASGTSSGLVGVVSIYVVELTP